MATNQISESCIMKCGYTIKKPNATRKSFAVHKKIYQLNAKPLQPIVKDNRLISINLNYRNNVLTFEQAHIQVKELITKFKKEQSAKDTTITKSEISGYNLKVYNSYMKSYYHGKPIVRKHNVTNEFNFALLAIEPLSIISDSKNDLQDMVDKAFNSKQSKRYVGRINQLLKFAGRDFTLFYKKAVFETVRYTSFADLKKVLAYVQDDDLKNLYYTLYCTGVRLGEAFVIQTRDIKKHNTIYIQNQMTEKKEIRILKNRKPHTTLILTEGLKYVKAWAALPRERKEELRSRCQQPLLHAVRKVYPADRDKQVSCHDLRHSYVIHLLDKGVPLDKCAKLIGDSIKTTEQYYAGFIATDNEIAFVTNILKKA